MHFNGNVKYNMSDTDKAFIDLTSKKVKLSEAKGIFYTTTKWTTKNNNYIHDQLTDKYYIIDINYYYKLNENCKVLINNDLIVNLK